jgi:tetratricopeptide (TPR) repeat protein
MRSRTLRAFELAFVLASLFGSRSASAGSCEELVRSARAHEASRDFDVALREYNDAVTLDPTCASAWLALGSLRARTGDPAEAERVYDAALTHVPGLSAAIAGRARSRWQLGRADEAESDMRAYAEHLVPTDPRAALAAYVELASWYAAQHRPPAQLACWRRIADLAHGVDPALAARARTTALALALVVGPADPVTHPPRADLLRSVAARLGIH